MTELQNIIVRHYGHLLSEDSPLFFPAVDRAIALENKVYMLTQMTQVPSDLALAQVQGSILSIDDHLKYAEYYNKFPTPAEREEIYLMGFDSWIRLNLL